MYISFGQKFPLIPKSMLECELKTHNQFRDGLNAILLVESLACRAKDHVSPAFGGLAKLCLHIVSKLLILDRLSPLGWLSSLLMDGAGSYISGP